MTLEVRSLSAAYEERPVLDEISFFLNPGQILAVIGPNGTGKSTLIRALSGIIPVQAGHIFIHGHDLVGMPSAERARLMAVMPQNIKLPAGFTAREVVRMGRTPYLNWLGQFSSSDQKITDEAMRRTNTLSMAERRVGELSGGEQQRLLLARALAQSTPILLMDEPTAHLDLQYQVGLLDYIRAIARQDQLAVLIVMHDMNLVARYADQIALLVDGKINALGSPQEVLTAARLSEVFHTPLEVITTPQHRTPIVVPINGKSHDINDDPVIPDQG